MLYTDTLIFKFSPIVFHQLPQICQSMTLLSLTTSLPIVSWLLKDHPTRNMSQHHESCAISIYVSYAKTSIHLPWSNHLCQILRSSAISMILFYRRFWMNMRLCAPRLSPYDPMFLGIIMRSESRKPLVANVKGAGVVRVLRLITSPMSTSALL